MRTKFDEQLEQLNVALITTGALCEDAISDRLPRLCWRTTWSWPDR